MPELIAFLEQTIKSVESYLEHRKEQVAEDEAQLEMLKLCLIALL